MFRLHLLPWITWLVYRLWSLSWRLDILESSAVQAARSAQRPLLYAHWHRDELGILCLVKTLNVATLTSLSPDGRLIDFVIRKLGGRTSAGSSHRGGASGLSRLIRLVRTGFSASMAVDGPRGPIYVPKPGVFELSRLSQARIVPVGLACRDHYTFTRAWNQACLPLPFTRVVVVLGNLLEVDTTRGADLRCPRLATALAEEIHAACSRAHRADRNFGPENSITGRVPPVI